MMKAQDTPRKNYDVHLGIVILKSRITKIANKEVIKTEPCPWCGRKHVHDFPKKSFQMPTKRLRNRRIFGLYETKCPPETPAKVAIGNGTYDIYRSKGYYLEHVED